MALCCIGGVCIPYSALLPLIVFGLQWIVKKLVAAGLFPESWSLALQQYSKSTNDSSKQPVRRGKQCKSVSCCAPVVECTSNEDWETLWCSTTAAVILIKFTAVWCKPCKAMQPHFEALRNEGNNRVQLASVDADELDDVASEYGVLKLPTFLAVDASTRKVVGTPYSGSDPDQLREWWDATQKKLE